MATPSKKFALSYSRINTYKTCPLQFEKTVLNKEVPFESNDAMEYGNRVHKSLENYCRSSGQESMLTRETKKWQGIADMVLALPGAKQFERKITLLEDLEQTTWFDKAAWMRAILDVMVVDGDTALVLDWKTGKVRPDMLQLHMFACIVFMVFPEVTTVKTAFIWLVHDETTQAIFRREHLDVMWKKIMEQCDAIQDSIDLGVFVATPSYLCNWCAARHICAYKE